MGKLALPAPSRADSMPQFLSCQFSSVAPLFAILTVVPIYSLGSRVSRPGAQGNGKEKGTPEWVGAWSKGQRRDGTWFVYMGCVYMVGGGLYREGKVGFYRIVGKWNNDLAPD